MTHTPPDLALIGRASTGKDTVADYLVEVHGYVRLAFADPLRALAAFVDPLVEPITHLRYTDAVEEFGYRQAKDTIPDFRRFLDRLGRGVREVLGEGLWVDALARKIDDLDPETPFVVTDCRFPNEARLLSVDFDAVTLRLTRAAAPVVDAPSEVALDDYAADLTFANDGTLDDLHAYLDALVLDPAVLDRPSCGPVIDALAALLPALSPLPYLAHPEVLVSALLALLKKEPVRVASFALAAVLILVATVTGVSLPVLLAEIGAAVVTLEKVRAVVAPMVDVIVHADDVPPGSVPVFLDLPQVAAPSPSSNVSVVDAPPSTDDVETLGGDL